MKLYSAILLIAFYFCCSSAVLNSQSHYPPITDQGITSTTHGNNIGKILWANQRIKFDLQDNITYSSEFKIGQPIYGRGYLAKCLYNATVEAGDDNCLNPENEYQLRVLVDGKDMGILNTNFFPSQEWTTFQISLVLSPGDSEDGINLGLTAKWAALVNEMEAGKHIVAIEFWGGKNGCDKKKFAEGTFTLDKTSNAKIKGNSAEVPKAKMNNAKLEKEMISAVKNQGWSNESPIDVVIIETDWRIIRDDFGNITDREINTFVILKDNNGNCRANDISFRQPYSGKSYGATQFYGLGLKSIPVDCTDYSK
jgi:hypothetical protein